MTNPANGATLEDCHSNFFALTDLCGIRWRRLVSEGPPGPGHTHHSCGPLDDPVLSSYARCLAADILCVWRRSPNSKLTQPPTPSDPFHINAATNNQASPHFMQQQHHHQHHHQTHMMPPQLPMGMGGGPQMAGHHGGPPPYPGSAGGGQHPPHGFSPQLSPMPHSAANFPPISANLTNNSLNGPKELWIFWYGEEPDLQCLVNAQLLNKTEPDQGSWESGLTYDCRTLLFKALHNLIEKCLLARDFVRIGKWFIQPSDESPRTAVKTFPMQLSFSFAFFLHGESTVCMSVDVRQHPSIKRVNKGHLQACQSPNQVLPVILAPHGLAGMLTGVGYRLNENGSNKILDEWKQFYPVEAALKSSLYDTTVPQTSHSSSSPHPSNFQFQTPPPNTGIPPVLEVLLGGVRMRYPACYVLVTEPEDLPLRPENNNLKSSAPGVTPKTKVGVNVDSESAACPAVSPNRPQSSSTTPAEVCKFEGALPERVWQEAILSSYKGALGAVPPPSKDVTATVELPNGATGTSSTLGQWDFVDPMTKSSCICSKCKRSSGSKSQGGSGQSTKSSKVKRSTFHRRVQKCQVKHWVNHWDGNSNSQRTLNNQPKGGGDTQGGGGSGANNQNTGNRSGAPEPRDTEGGPPSFKAGPGIGSEGPLPSPPSAAPSPLPTPTPRSQPASVSQQEPSMPTLSPQPSSDKALLAVSPDNCASNSISHQVFSPLVSGYDGANSKNGCAEQSTGPPPLGDLNFIVTNKDSANKQTGNNQSSSRGLLIRPSLPSKDYEALLVEEDTCQPSDTIYDYSSLEAWLYHPVKRIKIKDGQSKTSMYNWGLGMKKSHPLSGTAGVHERHQLGKRAADPYEFDDETHLAPVISMDGLKRKDGEDEKSPFCATDTTNGNKIVTGNLFTTEGLHPSLRDLDNLFDNSDTSSDETVPTPPGSNKPAGSHDDMGSSCLIGCGSNKGGGRMITAVRPEELSKMFPTPPSHEPNPISSPVGPTSENSSLEGLTDSTLTAVCLRRGADSYSGLGSPLDEPAEVRLLETNNSFHPLRTVAQHQLRMQLQDWSYVFKPPMLYKMLVSPKYAPHAVLPSQSHHLPPLTLPPNPIYKASWQFPPPPIQQTQQQQHPQHTQQQQQQQHQATSSSGHPLSSHAQHLMLAGPNIPNQLHLRPGLSPISPVPNSIRGTPFDMGSPPSSNMYLKQGPNVPPNAVALQQQQHPHNVPHPPHSGHPPHMYATRGVEAHALVVNLSLSDSVINLFRDHNFDSCTMCVCNASNKVIGNIRGSEVGLYIHDSAPDEEAVRCNCGFSATVNRRSAHHSGLFYEDEYEITTASVAPIALPSDDWYERKKTSFLMLSSKSSSNLSTPTNTNTGPTGSSASSSSMGTEKDGPPAVSLVDDIPPYLLEMLREQCMVMFGNCVASRFTGELPTARWNELSYNVLECVDANRAAFTALDHGRSVMEASGGRMGYHRLPEEILILRQNLGLMHKWAFRCARGPKSSQDVMQVMRGLHSLLQEAVHAKAWDAQYTVSGPLTWRMFHRLAGRGTEDRCEPQPIPAILVGSEKDWIALSPLAIKFWEKLLLEPYSYPRDVAYLVMAPDNDFICQKVRLFFREFSSMYEVCQLGRHCAISKVLRDGILRVGKYAATKLASEPVDEWFRSLPDHPTAAVLKLYAQVCRHYLVPQLLSISLDQSLFASHNQKSSHEKSSSSPKVPQPTPTIDVTGSTQGPPTPKQEPGTTTTSETDTKEVPSMHEPSEDDERDPPAIVIYIIDPFGFGSDDEDIHRLAKLGLLRCYHSMLSFIPENIKNNITLQIISLEDIINLGNSTLETRLKNDQMRALALSVYSQCRRLLTHQSNVKSLTGFGPAAAADLFIKSKDDKSRAGYKLYTPPYVLAPNKERLTEGIDWLSVLQGQTMGGLVSSGNNPLTGGPSTTPNLSSVLYVAYCLSEDQRWLIASVTDDRGELLETTTISMYVPNRSKRRKANARKHGLHKLMDFILGIMSTGASPWRLVVGRLGRVGHGELECWSTLLSRKSLLRASNQLKALCSQCSLQFPTEAPCVLSACLVSLEPDSCLRLMPDKFTPDERFSNSGTSASLSTPQDISCTHILVFPTSATTQSSQTAFQEQHMNDGPELGDDSDLLFMVNEGIDDGIDGMNDLQLGDIFNWPDTGAGVPSPGIGTSPRRDSTSQPGSPGIGTSGRQSPFQSGGQGRMGGRSDGSDEVGTLLQQPLALGYMVSTAPSGPLPSWFWASCPQRANEKGCGIFLKSALHLHSHSVFHNVDDPLQQQSNAKQHPLDSQYTTDVLRFVLEGYNALSWLALDTRTHDRRSCLPVHIQQLLQLYYTMASLV
ncbi:mediator of RNA polymerase II transcription subunit 13-like isoform X3 [Folsomia candida]|uniref:mediator of RNA polymerase II transcription subunit 13-like isoform X3 n=1 Tax=Folsomia candida TaxID=158441 RepID=UPI001605567C|nr:mediator of RNA polymerase II transcription subunit 13-like isoform X3 [Folsomia candida]